MDSGMGVGDTLSWSVWFLSEIAFKWMPGVVSAIVGTGDQAAALPGPSLHTVSAPVTVPQAVQFFQMASAPGVYDNLFYHWSVYVALSLFLSLLLITLIVYCVIRIKQIRYHEKKTFEAAAHTVVVQDAPKTQLRWKRVMGQADAPDEQGWRLAILEADIMLNELLDTLGYKGETMGDKMKQVERPDFRSIDAAWEAHKFRNKIAHEHMRLRHEDVERVIGLYHRVFREFHFVD